MFLPISFLENFESENSVSEDYELKSNKKKIFYYLITSFFIYLLFYFFFFNESNGDDFINFVNNIALDSFVNDFLSSFISTDVQQLLKPAYLKLVPSVSSSHLICIDMRIRSLIAGCIKHHCTKEEAIQNLLDLKKFRLNEILNYQNFCDAIDNLIEVVKKL